MSLPHFLDIETVSGKVDFEEVDKRTDEIYQKKFKHEFENYPQTIGGPNYVFHEPTPNVNKHYHDKAALYAEFGRVVCVSYGIVVGDKLRVKTIANMDEKKILEELAVILEKAPTLCAHNGKNFDFPFLGRRYLINGLDIPKVLNTMGKKPWETALEDTMEMWSFGQFKYSSSLDSLLNAFGLPSPKKDMDGSMVSEVFYSPCPSDQLPFDWEAANLKRIADYCASDLIGLVNLYMKLKRLPIIESSNITHV